MELLNIFFGREKPPKEPAPKRPIFTYGEIVDIYPEGANECFGEGKVIHIQEEFENSWGYTFGLGFYYTLEYPDGRTAKIHASELRRKTTTPG